MHKPEDRIKKGNQRKLIAWSIWALAIILILAGTFLPYKINQQAMTMVDENRGDIPWNPIVETNSVYESYLQTRLLSYDSEGRRIDDKSYVCTA